MTDWHFISANLSEHQFCQRSMSCTSRQICNPRPSQQLEMQFLKCHFTLPFTNQRGTHRHVRGMGAIWVTARKGRSTKFLYPRYYLSLFFSLSLAHTHPFSFFSLSLSLSISLSQTQCFVMRSVAKRRTASHIYEWQWRAKNAPNLLTALRVATAEWCTSYCTTLASSEENHWTAAFYWLSWSSDSYFLFPRKMCVWIVLFFLLLQ